MPLRSLPDRSDSNQPNTHPFRLVSPGLAPSPLCVEKARTRVSGEQTDNVPPSPSQTEPCPFTAVVRRRARCRSGSWPVAAPSHVEDGPDGRMARTAEAGDGVQANPWPYHGPGFGDDENGPSATVYPTVQHQGPGGLSTNGLDGDGDGDGKKASVAGTAARDTKTTPAPIKPYCPPPERHDISAGGLSSPTCTSAGPKSPAQVAYRPYRPPSGPSPSNSLGPAPHHSYRPFNPDPQPGSPAPVKATGEEEHEHEHEHEHAHVKPCSPPADTTATTSSPSLSEIPKKQSAASPALVPVSEPAPTTTTSLPSPPLPTPIRPIHSPQIPPPSPASSYTAHQPTYTPSPHSSPPPNYPGPHAQYANSGVAYPFPNESRPDSQPNPNPAGYQHQYPACSPPLASPYPVQPVYAPDTTPPNPPFPPGKGNPPPPLPPRRPQAQYYGGFGGGPVDAAAYPRPPKTHHNPMPPAYPPRPGSSPLTSGSLFSASSAKKWFDKTSQVLESKLEAILQGPSGPAYRPAYATNAPPQHHGMPPPPPPPPPAGSYNGCAPGPGPWGQGPPPGWRGP